MQTLWRTLGCLALASQAFAQRDTAVDLREIIVHERRFSETGFTRGSLAEPPFLLPVSLTDRLATQGTIQVRNNAPNTLATLSVRGAGPARSPVYWEGINLQNPMHGVVDLSLITIWPDDSVSIRHGGQSAVQRQGAMGGAVMVQSAARRHRNTPGWGGHAGFSGGSFGSANSVAGLDFQGRNFRAVARINHFKADNDFLFRNTTLLGMPVVRQLNNAIYKTDFQQFNDWSLRSRHYFRSAYWRQQAFREIPPSMTAVSVNSWQKDESDRAIIQWRFAPNARWHTSAKYALVREKIIFDLLADTDTSTSVQHSLDLNLMQRIGQNLYWRAGVASFLQAACSDGYADTLRRYQRNQVALYESWALNRPFLNISFNHRLEWQPQFKPIYTFSLGWHAPVSNAWVLRGHFSKNYNIPTLNDQFWAVFGKPHIAPEKGYSAELGLSCHTEQTDLQVAVYHLMLDNWIQWTPSASGVFYPKNLKKVWSRGLEWRLHRAFQFENWKTWLAWNGQLGKATNIAVYDDFKAGIGKQLLYTPVFSGNLDWGVGFGPFRIMAVFMHQGKRYTDAEGIDSVKGFHLANGYAQYKVSIRQKFVITFDLKINNIYNIDYQLIKYYPMPGRSYNFGTNFTF